MHLDGQQNGVPRLAQEAYFWQREEPAESLNESSPGRRPHVERILIATDGTAAAAAAVDCGLELAVATKAEVAFLHVVPDSGAEALNEGRALLDGAAARARDYDVACAVEIAHGDPAETILSRSEAMGSRVIVVGSRGRGGRPADLLGTVSRSVLRASERPVMIVHPPAEQRG